MASDKFRVVRGKVPRKSDFPKWSSEKIFALIQFTIYFMKMGERDGKEQFVYDITGEKIEQVKVSEEPFFQEFLARLHKKDMKLSAFRMRLFNAVKSVTEYLQENPQALTPEIEQLVTGNNYWERCLNVYSEQTNLAKGTSIAIKDPNASLSEMKTPLAQYHQGLLKMASVFNGLLKGLTQAELGQMSPEKRLRIANNLLHSLSKAVTAQQNTKVFNTIVLNKAGRDDLEKSILEYSETQNIQEE